MADVRPLPVPRPEGATGVVVFADGRTVWGQGFGAEGDAVGEPCFNTAMTGYQEVMTDPSYAKQVIAFTFPHIGNVGANDEDVEAAEAHALGCLVREVVTEPSNYRANQGFADWMRKWGRIGIAGVDTRALTKLVRTEGPPRLRSRTARTAGSTWRRCGGWRPSGRGSKAWTWRRRSAGCRSSGGRAGSGIGRGMSYLPLAGGRRTAPRWCALVGAPISNEAPPAPSRKRRGGSADVVAVDYGSNATSSATCAKRARG